MGKIDELVEGIQAYKYIDVHQVLANGKRTKWNRIPKTDLDKYRKLAIKGNAQHVFSTIQLFANKEHIEDEAYICPLYFDLDSDTDLEEALVDARIIKDYFCVGFDSEEGIEYFFSGNRGFHITISSTLFGAAPASDLVKIWRHIAEEVSKMLSLKTFDRSVYTKRRMWRVENTKHGKSDLWKIRLYPYELALSVDKIRELAVSPRIYEDIDDGGNS